MFLSRRESPEGNKYDLSLSKEGAYAHTFRWIREELSMARYKESLLKDCRAALLAGNWALFLELWNGVGKSYYAVVEVDEPVDRSLLSASVNLRRSIDKLLVECEKANHETLVDDVFEELSKKT